MAKEPKEKRDDKSKFQPWKGGKCPVERGTKVDIVFRNATTARGVLALLPKNEQYNCNAPTAEEWEHKGLPTDIIAYKVLI